LRNKDVDDVVVVVVAGFYILIITMKESTVTPLKQVGLYNQLFGSKYRTY